MHAAVCRLASVTVLAVAASGCGFAGPDAVAWGARVVTPAPDVLAAQPVIARGQGTVTLLPVSPSGARVGVGHGYAMPHCGIRSPIDVDGTYWDPVGIGPDSVEFDGIAGTFRLESPTEATFTSRDGRVLRLVRHDGAKAFPSCD